MNSVVGALTVRLCSAPKSLASTLPHNNLVSFKPQSLSHVLQASLYLSAIYIYIYTREHISMCPKSHRSPRAQEPLPRKHTKKGGRAAVLPLGGWNPPPGWGSSLQACSRRVGQASSFALVCLPTCPCQACALPALCPQAKILGLGLHPPPWRFPRPRAFRRPGAKKSPWFFRGKLRRKGHGACMGSLTGAARNWRKWPLRAVVGIALQALSSE